SAFEVARDFFGRERSRSAVEARPWMRSRSAQIQARHRWAVARPPEKGTRHEELIERELAVKNMSTGQSIRALEVERRDHLPGDDGGFESWCVRGNRPRHAIGQPIALCIPVG